MRTEFIPVALVTVLLSPSASAQVEQAIAPNEQHLSHLAGTRTNGFQSTRHLFRTDAFNHDGMSRSKSPIRKAFSSQSEIYVIDTAIVVRSSKDTTRHLYSFNAAAKTNADLTQKLTGGLWKDTLRGTYTYDASNNMLSDLKELWSNGQLANSYRYTYAYDASGSCRSIEEARDFEVNGDSI
jgi:hypothetical protein